MDTFGPIVSVMVGASHDVAEVGIDPGEMTGPGRPSYLKTEAKHSISFQGSENKHPRAEEAEAVEAAVGAAGAEAAGVGGVGSELDRPLRRGESPAEPAKI